MKILLRLLGTMLALASLPFFLFGIQAALQSRTQQLSPSQEPLLGIAKSYAQEFRKRNNRLPSYLEFDDMMHGDKDNFARLDGKGFSYRDSGFPRELEEVIGDAPPESFIISYWNGHAFLLAPSWSKRQDEVYVLNQDYWVMGSKTGDVIGLLLSGLIFLGLGACCFVLMKRRDEGKAGAANASP